MSQAEKISFIFWVVWAIDLWDRYKQALNMLVNLELGWLVVSNLLTMIRLAKTALKLPFDADTSLIALIHLGLYTF